MAASSDSMVKIGLSIEGLQDAAASLEKIFKLCQGINPNQPTTTASLTNGAGGAATPEGGSHPGIQHGGNFELKSADAMAQHDVDTLLKGQALTPTTSLANSLPLTPDHALAAQQTALNNMPSVGATITGGGASQAIGRFGEVLNVNVISMPRVDIGNWPQGYGGGGGGGNNGGGNDKGGGGGQQPHPDLPKQQQKPKDDPENPTIPDLHKREQVGRNQIIEDLTKDIKSAPMRTMAEEFLTGTRGGNLMLQKMGVVHDAFPAMFDKAMAAGTKALPLLGGVSLAAEGAEFLADGYNTFTARGFEISKEAAGKRSAGITIDPFNESIDRGMADRDRWGDMAKKYLPNIPVLGMAANAILEGTYYRNLEMQDEVDKGSKIRHTSSQQFSALTGASPYALTDDLSTAASGAAGLASALGGLAPLNRKWAQEYSKESYDNYAAGNFAVQDVNNSFGVLSGVLSSNSFVAQQKQMLSGAKNPMDFAKMGMETLALRGDTAGVQAMAILLDKPAVDKHAEELKALGFKEGEELKDAQQRHQITRDVERPKTDWGDWKSIGRGLMNSEKPVETVTQTDPAWLAKYQTIQSAYLKELAAINIDTVKAMKTALDVKTFEFNLGIDQSKSAGAASDMSRMRMTGANLTDIAKFQSGDMSAIARDELKQNLGELAKLNANPTKDKLAIENAEAKIKGNRAEIASDASAALDTLNQKLDLQNNTRSLNSQTALDLAINSGGGNDDAIHNAFASKRGAEMKVRDALIAKSKMVDRYDADTRANFAAQAQHDFQLGENDQKQEFAFFDKEQESATAVAGSLTSQRQSYAHLFGSSKDMLNADLGSADILRKNMTDTQSELAHAKQLGTQEDVNRLTAQYNSQLTQLISATTTAARSFQDAGVMLNQIRESTSEAIIARDGQVGSTFTKRRKNITDSIDVDLDTLKREQDIADGKTGLEDKHGFSVKKNPLLAGGGTSGTAAGGGAGGASSTAHVGKGNEKDSAIAVRIVASIPLEFSGSGHGGGHSSGHGGSHHAGHGGHSAHHATHSKAHGGAHHGAGPGTLAHPDGPAAGDVISPDGVMGIPVQDPDSERRLRAQTQVERTKNKILNSIDQIAGSPQDVKDRMEQVELDTRRMISKGTFSSQGNLIKQDYEEIGLIGKREKFQQQSTQAALDTLAKYKSNYSPEEYQNEVDSLNLKRAEAKKGNVSAAMSAFGEIQQQQQGAFLMNVMNAPGRFSAISSQFTRMEAAPMMQQFGPSWGFTEKKERDDWMFAGSRMRENFGVNGVTGGDMNPNHAEGFFNQTMARAGLAGAGGMRPGGNSVLGVTPSAMIESMMGGMPSRTLSKEAPSAPVRVELIIKNDGSVSSNGQTITRGQLGVIHAINNTVTTKDVPARGASHQ